MTSENVELTEITTDLLEEMKQEASKEAEALQLLTVPGHESYKIPRNYEIGEFTQLYLWCKGKKKDEPPYKVLLTSTTPFITYRLKDIESNNYSYNLYFNDRKKPTNLTVLASEITQRKKFVELASKGIDVNDTNSTDLVKFISQAMRINYLDTIPIVSRLGHIKNHFFLPQLDNKEVKILPTETELKRLCSNFKQKGTLQSYKDNVFNLIKNEPTAMVVMYASLGSVLLKPLQIEPFILDLSGKTSTGKTTVLKLASSVWGTDKLVKSWNSTIKSLEDTASFLNSLPIMLDDTRSGKDYVIKDYIYLHSTGMSKGRGTPGGMQEQKYWQSILLSTGENAISEYTDGKGGASARCITLEESPFTFKGFTPLYEAIGNNYGTLGVAFIQQYNKHQERYKKAYKEIQANYFELGNDNEVLERLSRAFALLELSGMILNDLPGFEHDYHNNVLNAHKSMLLNNKSVDKPLELLVKVLEYIDSHRNGILYKDLKFTSNNGEIIAIYKDNFLCLMPNKLKELLGIEFNKTIKEWRDRGYLVPGKERIQKQVKHSGTGYNVYTLKHSIINECGFDFKVIGKEYNINLKSTT